MRFLDQLGRPDLQVRREEDWPLSSIPTMTLMGLDQFPRGGRQQARLVAMALTGQWFAAPPADLQPSSLQLGLGPVISCGDRGFEERERLYRPQPQGGGRPKPGAQSLAVTLRPFGFEDKRQIASATVAAEYGTAAALRTRTDRPDSSTHQQPALGRDGTYCGPGAVPRGSRHKQFRAWVWRLHTAGRCLRQQAAPLVALAHSIAPVPVIPDKLPDLLGQPPLPVAARILPQPEPVGRGSCLGEGQLEPSAALANHPSAPERGNDAECR